MKEPLYSIKEVSMQTGLSTQLIRKWEQRYEAVEPQRMPNGYRGYTKRDIETLQWLKQRVEEGKPIGMAASELKQRLSGPIQKDAARLTHETGKVDWQESIAMLLHYFERVDLHGAEQVMDRLMAVASMDELLIKVIRPAMVELGDRWERGDISEYQEHFGSHFIRDKIMSARSTYPAIVTKPLLVTACGPGERHELGIVFVGYFAMKLGFQVIYLGASPSEKGLLDCVRERKPAAIALSFTSSTLLEQAKPFLLELDASIKAFSPGTDVFIGGQAVQEDGTLPHASHVHLLLGEAELAAQHMAALKLRTAK